MAKIFIMTEFGNSETVEMKHVPRIGDTIPLFGKPFPKVQNVIWFPEKVDPELVGKGINVIVLVG